MLRFCSLVLTRNGTRRGWALARGTRHRRARASGIGLVNLGCPIYLKLLDNRDLSCFPIAPSSGVSMLVDCIFFKGVQDASNTAKSR